MTDKVDLILGLDVSTAVTGVAVLEPDGSLLELDFVDTRKCDTLWDVADAVRHRISRLNLGRSYAHLFVEEDLKRFRRGLSSADTISALAKVNGIVSYLARTALAVEPVHIQATKARSECGVVVVKAKTQDEKDDPRWVKKQVFDQMLAQHPELRARQWQQTKPSRVNPAGRLRDECFDMVDAYVVARAGWLRTRT